MPTTAGVIRLSIGASDGMPLACWMTGSGTLALAAENTFAVSAMPSATAPTVWFMVPILRWRTKSKRNIAKQNIRKNVQHCATSRASIGTLRAAGALHKIMGRKFASELKAVRITYLLDFYSALPASGA
jgi:hypothetical protein